MKNVKNGHTGPNNNGHNNGNHSNTNNGNSHETRPNQNPNERNPVRVRIELELDQVRKMVLVHNDTSVASGEITEEDANKIKEENAGLKDLLGKSCES